MRRTFIPRRLRELCHSGQYAPAVTGCCRLVLPGGEAVAILILRCGIVHLVGLGLTVQKQEKSNGIHLAGEGESVTNPDFQPDMESTSSYGWYHKTLDSHVELQFNAERMERRLRSGGQPHSRRCETAPACPGRLQPQAP